MSDVVELRGLSEIESRRLVWEKLWGETRWQHFTLRWDFFRLVARWSAHQWEPLVLEARWGDRILGLLPLLSHRKFKRWASPNLVTGIGPALMLGKEVTAAWMQIARFMRRRSVSEGTMDLGPFDPRMGVGSRLETAFHNLAQRKLARLSVNHREVDTTLKAWGSNPQASAQWEAISTATDSRFEQGLPDHELNRLVQMLEDPRFVRHSSISGITDHPNLAIDAVHELSAAGLLWLTRPKQKSGGQRQIVWVGDRNQVEPLIELHPGDAGTLTESELLASLAALHLAGIKVASLGNFSWPQIDHSETVEQRTYGYAPRLDVRNAWHALWNPLKIATPILR